MRARIGKHTATKIRKGGWEPLPTELPSCYFHNAMKMFLIIYVDDFKMAGPKGNFVGAWDSITSQGIRLDEPAPLT